MLGRVVSGWEGERTLVLVEGADADLRKRLSEGQIDAALTLMRAEDRERPSIELAEDAAAEAFAIAAERWPREGPPDNPGAWLVVTARHRAINRIRRDRTLAGGRWFPSR